jgi:glycyl-tRNA synthetase (class II)
MEEIGTIYSVKINIKTVTIRDRDSQQQERVNLSYVESYIRQRSSEPNTPI